MINQVRLNPMHLIPETLIVIYKQVTTFVLLKTSRENWSGNMESLLMSLKH